MQKSLFLVSVLSLNLYSNFAVARDSSANNLAQVDGDTRQSKTKKAKGAKKIATNVAPVKSSSEAVEESSAVPANTSAANRANQSFSLLLGSNPSFTAEYSISRDLHINLNYVSVAANIFHLSESSNLFSINFKYFNGNSFYLTGGAGYRQAVKKGLENILFNEKDYFTRKTTDLGVTAGIGNQWQWSKFTLGADWVGIYQPMSTLSSDTHAYDYTTKTYTDASDPSYKAGTLLTSRFYIGLSF